MQDRLVFRATNNDACGGDQMRRSRLESAGHSARLGAAALFLGLAMLGLAAPASAADEPNIRY